MRYLQTFDGPVCSPPVYMEPRAAPSSLQQSRPPPVNVLPFQIAWVQQGKALRPPASAKGSGTSRRIYLGAEEWTDPPLPGPQVWEPGLPSSDAHTPLVLRFAAHPTVLCSGASRAAWGSPTPWLRPGARWGAARGGGGGGGSHCSLHPYVAFQPVGIRVYTSGAGDYSLPSTPAFPSSTGIPFPPCGCGNTPNSRAPGPEGGCRSADSAAEVEGCRSRLRRNKGTLVL